MRKILIIEECADCLYSHYEVGLLVCWKLNRDVEPLEIPDDCPLPNAEEEG